MSQFKFRISRLFTVNVHDYYVIQAADEDEANEIMMGIFMNDDEDSRTNNPSFNRRRVSAETMTPLSIDNYNDGATEELYYENPDNPDIDFYITSNEDFYEQEHNS